MRHITKQCLSVVGFLLLGSTSWANPTITYKTRYGYGSMPTISSVVSLVSAMTMAAYGWSGRFPDRKDTLLEDCASESERVRSSASPLTGLKWYDGKALPFRECNPQAIANVVSARFPAGSSHWQVYIQDAVSPTNAADFIINQFIRYQSPVVIPLSGGWGSWATIVEVDASAIPSGYKLERARLIDGFTGAIMDMPARTFNMTYWPLFSYDGAICEPDHDGKHCDDGPYFDSWYNKFIAIHDPPTTATTAARSLIPVSYERAPALVTADQMSTDLATSRVFEALRLAGRDASPEVKSLMQSGHADPARLVRGRWPSGARHDYYLLAVRSQDGRVTAFVQLDAEDGSFEQLTMLAQPIAYNPISAEAAQKLARTALRPGESLGNVTLAWDPAVSESVTSRPYLPYYELTVHGRDGTTHEVVRVALDAGALLGRISATP